MQSNISVKREFDECVCVKSDNDIFVVGHIYPICGDNDGKHVIGVNSLGRPYDLLCYSYRGKFTEEIIESAKDGTNIIFIPFER